MNETIKAEWLAALRSGEYKQGRGQLHAEDTFCCLGVLCDLHIKAGQGEWDIDDYSGLYMYMNEREFPPIEVMRWAGLEIVNPKVAGTALTSLNDGVEGYDEEEDCEVIYETPRTFAEIADLIEAHL